MSKAPQTAITPTRQEDYPEWYQQVIKAADLAETSPTRGRPKTARTKASGTAAFIGTSPEASEAWRERTKPRSRAPSNGLARAALAAARDENDLTATRRSSGVVYRSRWSR
jgi:hypothetical protein